MKKLIFLLTFIFTITMFSHNGNTAPVTDGLVSYWTFDQQNIAGNTAKDVWGKNDGTIVGNPKRVAGRVNGALEFDGSDDYVNLTNLGDFGGQVGTSTFEAWIKTSLREDRWTTLFKVRDVDFADRDPGGIKIGGPDCGMGWGIDLNGWAKPAIFAKLGLKPWHFVENLIINDDDSISFDKDIIRFYLTHKLRAHRCWNSTSGWRFPISDGEWHHLVYINGVPYVDENGRELRERAIFIDGKREWLSRHRWEPGDFIPFTEPVYLGAGNNRGEAEAFYNGIIDEVRIYNRPLTADEVSQNFEIGLSVEAAEKLPVVWGALKTAQ